MAIEPIRLTISVPLSPDRAFARFTERMTEWWPREYSWSGEALDEIAIEPWLDGMCYETGPYGFRCDWGRVVAWEPPALVAFTWQISPNRGPLPDPRKASEVEVRFTAAGDGTELAFEHRHFERHGDAAIGYREALAGAQGWPYILRRYVEGA